MTTNPEPTTNPHVIICYTKCWPCQLGQHDGGTHTWMDAEDIEHAGNIPMPTTPQEWAHLAATHPCGCYCAKESR